MGDQVLIKLVKGILLTYLYLFNLLKTCKKLGSFRWISRDSKNCLWSFANDLFLFFLCWWLYCWYFYFLELRWDSVNIKWVNDLYFLCSANKAEPEVGEWKYTRKHISSLLLWNSWYKGRAITLYWCWREFLCMIIKCVLHLTSLASSLASVVKWNLIFNFTFLLHLGGCLALFSLKLVSNRMIFGVFCFFMHC